VEQEKLDMMLTFLTTAQAMLDEAAPAPGQMPPGELPAGEMPPAGELPMGEMSDVLEEMSPATPGPMELPQEIETAPPPDVLPS
jgi:hypothetical protein